MNTSNTQKRSYSLFIVPLLIAGMHGYASFIWDAQPLVLWTDSLVYLLVLGVAGFLVYASGKEHLRDPWKQISRSRLGMASLVFLLSFVIIGLLDSIHFRLPVENNSQQIANELNTEIQYGTETDSMLDIWLGPLKTNVEKTYSAPFSAYQFTKETIEHDDGSRSREYPRLIFGGAHLEHPESEISADVLSLAIKGMILGFFAWLVLVGVVCIRRQKKLAKSFKQTFLDILYGKTESALNIVLLAIGFIFIFIGFSAELATKYHIFGTDKVGQDVFYQSIKSIRTGLVIGTLTTLIMLPFAVMLGIMAGYFRGRIDDLIQYLYTTLSSIPGVLLIAAAVLIMQVYMANNPDLFETDVERADLKLFFLCVILGITSWTGLCRMLRGESLKLTSVEYVQASQALGVSHLQIIWKHIQPNVAHIILIAVVLDFSGLVLAEAVLSYIGIGVDPSMHSWGNMINSARLEMAREPIVWWSLLAAFIFMFILVLSANLFSDAVRDAFDPRIRKQ